MRHVRRVRQSHSSASTHILSPYFAASYMSVCLNHPPPWSACANVQRARREGAHSQFSSAVGEVAFPQWKIPTCRAFISLAVITTTISSTRDIGHQRHQDDLDETHFVAAGAVED